MSASGPSGPLVIGFLSNFIYGLLLSISHSSSNMGFVSRMISKMADKMAAAYQGAGTFSVNILYTVKPVLSRHSKEDQNLVFKTDYFLMQVKVL